MGNLEEFYPYIQLVTALVSAVLAVALASSIKNLIGKGWLVASAIIFLVTTAGFQIIGVIAPHFENPRQIYPWYGVLSLIALFGTACFGLFLLSNWAKSRMKLDMKNLLFSFRGRIPRSAFWISFCILWPLFTTVGIAPFTTQGGGLPMVMIWIVYAGSLVLSTWVALAIYTKRWHDCSKSGWMSLILLIPVVGGLWLIGYLGFVKGTPGANQYGEDPINQVEPT